MKTKSTAILLTVALLLTAFLTACSNSTSAETTVSETTASLITVTVDITDDKAVKTSFTLSTSGTTLLDALNEKQLVEGEEGPYGMYVKKVNGVTADYDANGAYWAFYKGGEYLSTGIEKTPIANGEHYEIVWTKG